jgi:hypothetical protein
MKARYRGDPLADEEVFEAPEVEDAGLGPEEGIEVVNMPSLDVTWSVLDTEPGMDGMAEQVDLEDS